MIKRIAAHKICLSEHHVVENAAVVVIDGVVADIVPCVVDGVEQSGTAFYNGVITPDFNRKRLCVGSCLGRLLTVELAVGYAGPLWLWTHINVKTLQITDSVRYQNLEL